MTTRFIVGDVFEVMATIPDGTVDLVLTSPPFLALRSYLPADHPDKGKEIGSEPTPAVFIDRLLALTVEWGRVLAPHGSIAIELGDTYAGSGGAGGDYNPDGLRDGQQRFDGSASRAYGTGARPRPPRNRWRSPKWPGRRDVPGHEGHPTPDTFKGGGPGDAGWPPDKSLCGIPTLYAWSLAYGRNLLRRPMSARELLKVAGWLAAEAPWLNAIEVVSFLAWFVDRYEEANGGPGVEIEPWRIRNVKPWIRSNPPVGALGDKERPATSYVVVACRGRDRWFDLDSVRTGTPLAGTDFAAKAYSKRDVRTGTNWGDRPPGSFNPAGAPPLDWFHQVDALIDAVLADMAGKPSTGGPVGKKRRDTFVGGWADGVGGTEPYVGPGGARGVHIRRALEHAGYVHTLDAMDISPTGYSGAHYAVFPKELVKQLVAEMCPRRVCRTCGEPSRRIVVQHNDADRRQKLATHIRDQRTDLGLSVKDVAAWFPSRTGGLTGCVSNWEAAANVPTADQWPILKDRLGLSDEFDDLVLGERRWTFNPTEYVGQNGSEAAKSPRVTGDFQGSGSAGKRDGGITAQRKTLGWSDCGCPDEDRWRPGLVLDPFVGSGTTLEVCSGMDRDSLGVDLDERNAELAVQRCGMLLEVSVHEAREPA